MGEKLKIDHSIHQIYIVIHSLERALVIRLDRREPYPRTERHALTQKTHLLLQRGLLSITISRLGLILLCSDDQFGCSLLDDSCGRTRLIYFNDAS